jgi:hypothetical protein
MLRSLIREGFRVFLLFLCLGVAAAFGSQFNDNQSDEALYHSSFPGPVQTDLRVLEREWHLIPDGPTIELSIEHLRKMADAARQLIVLTVDGVDYPAESVYFTPQPDGFTCRLLVADDTAHTTEFPLSQPAVPWQPGITLQLRRPLSPADTDHADIDSDTVPRPTPGAHDRFSDGNTANQQQGSHVGAPPSSSDASAIMPPEWPAAYTADPAEMHGATFSVEIHRPDSEGRFQPKLRRTDRRQLLFMIIKEPETEFHRKYVWVIEAGRAGN